MDNVYTYMMVGLKSDKFPHILKSKEDLFINCLKEKQEALRAFRSKMEKGKDKK